MAPVSMTTISGGMHVSAQAKPTDGSDGSRCDALAIRAGLFATNLRGGEAPNPRHTAGNKADGMSVPRETLPSAAKAAG